MYHSIISSTTSFLYNDCLHLLAMFFEFIFVSLLVTGKCWYIQ